MLMPVRIRKLIGSLAIMVFLFAYVSLVVVVADHVPDQWAVKLAFFGLAGVLWGVPLLPLIRWMNREP
jgi:hypothetical protein